jgi:hypothetical protein
MSGHRLQRPVYRAVHGRTDSTIPPPTTHTYTPHCTYTFTGTISSPSTVLRSGGRWESNHTCTRVGKTPTTVHRHLGGSGSQNSSCPAN